MYVEHIANVDLKELQSCKEEQGLVICQQGSELNEHFMQPLRKGSQQICVY